MSETGLRTREQDTSVERHLMLDYYHLCVTLKSTNFLSYLTMAFLKADGQNFELLRPIIREMIRIHSIKCTCEKEVIQNW